MNSFDYILIALLLLLSIRGFTNGFKNELINLIGIAGGIYIASRLAPPLAQFLNQYLHIENQDLLKSAVFLGLFAISWIITGQIKKRFGNPTYAYYSEPLISNIEGALVNIAKNIAIISIFIALIGSNQKLHGGYINTIKSSAAYKPLQNIGNHIILLDKN